MKKQFALALGALSLIALTGCPDNAAECSTNTDCGSFQACIEGTCYAGTCQNGGITCGDGLFCANNRCVTCTATEGCTAPQVCNVAANSGAGACVQCVNNANCSGETPACNLANNTCAKCTATYCALQADRPFCDTNTGCICRDNGDCSATEECGASQACADVDVAAGSAGIAAFIAAADGTLATPIAIPNVLVTYTRAAMTNGDPAGFFVQAEATGPAMFVELDPATQSPVISQGDRISFNATTKGTTSSGSIRRATAISGLTKVSLTPHPVTEPPPAGLLQNVTETADLVSALDTYLFELISVESAAIISNFVGAGTGYSAAELETAGVLPDADTGLTGLRLRLPSTVVTELDLVNGCVVTVSAAPMWKFNTTAQINPMKADEVTIESCPAPVATNAVATSETKVVIFFDRQIDAASVAASDFTIAGLAVSAVSVTGKQVELTTDAQTAGNAYSITIGEVKDKIGSATTTTSVAFYGYSTVAAGAVVINEIDYDNVGTDNAEFIELYNKTAEAQFIDGLVVVLVNGGTTPAAEYSRVALSGARTGDNTPTNVLPAGGYVVLASAGYFASAAGQAIPAGVLRVVIPGTADLIQNGGTDALGVLHYATGNVIDALSYEGTVGAANIATGAGTKSLVLTEGAGTSLADVNTSGTTILSLGRSASSADTNVNLADFATKTTLTPGAANP